ncbi:MAG: 16S rRNA (uracil(1498)-N(3))-methyltransferase [Pseudomonadota bacterium]
MTIRLHLNQQLGDGAEASLSAEQVHYLRTVMRRQEGDALLVFNARDGEYAAVINSLSKKTGLVTLGARTRVAESEPDLWLLFAPIKRGPVDIIAQKATELGVSVLAPVSTERTNAGRVNTERLSAIATEAAEQCDRLSVPEVRTLQKLEKALADWPHDRLLIFCDEAGENEDDAWGGREGRAAPMLEVLRTRENAAESAAILIGPEGGFSREERALLRAKPYVAPVTLGPRILRADTAAIAAVTLWQAACGDFRKQ